MNSPRIGTIKARYANGFPGELTQLEGQSGENCVHVLFSPWLETKSCPVDTFHCPVTPVRGLTKGPEKIECSMQGHEECGKETVLEREGSCLDK